MASHIAAPSRYPQTDQSSLPFPRIFVCSPKWLLRGVGLFRLRFMGRLGLTGTKVGLTGARRDFTKCGF